MTNHTTIKALCAGGTALCASLAAGATAAQEIIELGEISVTANLVETELDATGSSVAVLTEDEIAAAGEVELVDLLNRLPGVSATQAGPLGGSANIRIRGADARYIAVYIDGIRVGDPSLVQTQFEFGGLGLADIDRIELLRGSQSALYGGSAVGGVIAITTRRAEGPGVSQSVDLEAGSYGTVSASYGASVAGERGEVAMTLSHARSDGFSAADENDGNTEADGYRGTRLSLSGSHRVSDTLTLGFAAFGQRQHIEFDGLDSFYVLSDQPNTTERSETGARLYAELQTGRTEHLFDLSAYRVDRETTDSNGVSEFSGRRLGFAWQATSAISPALRLVYGADHAEERARYDALPAGEEVTRVSGAFVQALWAAGDRLDVSASLRRDELSSYGGFTSARLAAAWRPDETLTFRAAVARGFRAPSIDERFGSYPAFFFVGNPDLTPEESMSYELGVAKEFAGGGVVSATLFQLEIDNLITYDAVAAPNSLENVPGVSTRKGLELAARLPLGDHVTVDLAYTYTDARRPNGARIDLVPLHQAELAVTAALGPKLTARAAAAHRAGVVEFGAPHPSYTVVGLGLDYALTDDAALTLRVENLFDEEYQMVRGYGTSDRAIYAGLRARF